MWEPKKHITKKQSWQTYSGHGGWPEAKPGARGSRFWDTGKKQQKHTGPEGTSLQQQQQFKIDFPPPKTCQQSSKTSKHCPETPLVRRGSSCAAGCTQNLPWKHIIRQFRGDNIYFNSFCKPKRWYVKLVVVLDWLWGRSKTHEP